jgi:ribosome-interacting GTPase 1
MAVMMSHPINDQIKEAVEEEVNNMPALQLLNKCDELGIKTSELPMEELMDQLHDALVEIRMQP